MKSYLTDIDNIKVGHAHTEDGSKGVTVILCEEGCTGGVDVRGSAPGTRETDLFEAEKLVDKVHAIVLSGGSAFGLDCAGGVMEYLDEKNIGFKTPFANVPIVAQAVIYDLNSGDPKIRPDRDMGYEACKNASSEESRRGCIGAGLGASVSKAYGNEGAFKSGLGSASIEIGDLKVAALAVVNALGDVYDGEKQLTGPRNPKTNKIESTIDLLKKSSIGFENTNTTIAVIATNAKLNKAMANKLAQVSHDGFARAIRPVHTMSDGDTVFALASNQVEANFDLVLSLAADLMEEAIIDAVYSAESMNNFLAFRDYKD